MSDIESEVVLRLRVLDDVVQATRNLDKYNEEIGFSDKLMAQAGRTGGKLRQSLTGLAEAANDVGKNMTSAAKNAGSKEWQALSAQIDSARDAYRSFRQEVALGAREDLSFDQWINSADSPTSRGAVQAYSQGMAGSLTGDEAKTAREAEQAISDWAEAERRLNAAQGQRRAEEAGEAHRQTEIYQATRNRAEAERQLAIQLARRAEEERNASNARRWQAENGVDSRLGGQGSGMRARDTGLAAMLIAEEAGAERARKALADHDAQLNSNAVGYRASTSALAGMLRAEEEQINALPRLRYALYDVGTSLTITGAAMAAFGVITAGTAIKMQRDFADVVRTSGAYLDPTGRSVSNLRGEFEELFATLPASWADLTQIGTLGGQLDIATQDLDEFTRLVTMFTATTDVSVEASATAFGRLAQLLGVSADEYEKMGSSILAVGTSSVATEGQIIAISKEIASVAATANFSADEVFGLSAALASLGTQPELSRGVITRLFANIGRSINDGGEQLETFGALSGMTGRDFAKAWGDDAAGALEKLMKGLGGVAQSDAISVLSSLGIEASRDVPTILRLAQNSEVLARALDTAGEGYRNGTELADQYSVISSTVSEKLTVLVNNFQLLVGTVGEAAGGAGFLVDALIAVTKAITGIMDNPVAATVGGITLAFTILGGALLILVGLITRGAGSIYAMRTAMAELGISAGTTAFSLTGLTTALLGTEVAAGKAATTARVASIALRAISIAGLATIAIPVAEWMSEWTKSMQGAVVETQAVTDALVEQGASVSSLEALEAQVISVGKAAGAFSSFGAVPLVGAWADSIRDDLAGAETELDAGLARLSMKTTTWLNTPSNFGAGFLGDDAGVAPWASGLDPGIAEIESMVDGFVAAWNNATTAIDQQAIVDKYEEMKAASMAAAISMGTDADTALEGWTYNWEPFIAATEGGVDAMALAGEESIDLAESITDTLAAFLEIENVLLGTESAMYALGDALGENGSAWDRYSEGGRANIGALMDVINAVAAETPGNAQAISANLQALFETIVQGGFASAEQLSLLQNIINSLSGGKAVQANSARDFSSLFSGVSNGMETLQKKSEKAGRAVRQTREEVRTLADYARDLGGVFSRAFEIRFGSEKALDEVAGGWLRIANAADDARQSIEEHQAKLLGLTSDESIKKYWLSIAELYGDEMRAAEIRAELAEINLDVSKTQKDLAKAQDKSSMSLTGNSEAALENRANLLGLVGNYQQYLEALASSGMSQQDLQAKSAQLKAEFVAQALQMGYSRAEVDKYALSFDDMALAIGRVPRNITVSANTNPALQALAEFEARMQKMAATTYGGGTIAPPNTAAASAVIEAMAKVDYYAAALNSLSTQRPVPMSALDHASTNLSAWQAKLKSLRGYSSGGYVGDGGKYEPRGVVHGGEFVFSKEATSFFGPNFLNSMHSAGKKGGGTPFAASAGGGMTELGPATLYALAELLKSETFLDGRVVATSVTKHSTQNTAFGGS